MDKLPLDWRKFVSIEILFFAITSLAAVSVAYTDVKSDIAVVKEKVERNENRYGEIDKKLDNIWNYLLNQRKQLVPPHEHHPLADG